MGKGSGASGARGGGAAGGGRRSLTASEVQAAEKAIDKGSFQKVGNGNWEFNTDSSLGIGAQILDETGSSRDPMYGRGGKVYGVTTWGQAPGDVRTTIISGSLNDAKAAAREEMKGWLPSVTVRR